MKILSQILGTVLKKQSKDAIPKVGDFYVVQGGTYGGDYLMLMEKKEDGLHFFVLPDKKKRIINEKDFDRGRKNKIVEFIENVPSAVLKDCKYEYSRLNI